MLYAVELSGRGVLQVYQVTLEEFEVMHHADIHGFNVHFAHRLDNRRWAMLIRP